MPYEWLAPVDDLDDAALLPAYGGKMGVDATRKWPSEGFGPAGVGLIPAAPRMELHGATRIVS